MSRIYLNILKELGWPAIFLIHPEQFQHVDGDKIEGLYGNSNAAGFITVHPGLPYKVLRNTFYHEIGHILFPDKSEGWIWMYGHIMARGGDDGQECPEDDIVMPSRKVLLQMSRQAAKEFNKRR